MLVKEAIEITGGLSNPSKMPGRAYNTSAFDCKRGSRLAEIPGTICSTCYARKGRYVFPKVQRALRNRANAFDHPLFLSAMSLLIKRQSPDYFRWFDSGDLQSVEQLRIIVKVCEATPNTKHWLPTREYNIVAAYRATYMELFPPNLTVRMSTDKVDQVPGSFTGPYSMVSSRGYIDGALNCPAPKQGNECGNCRGCWNPNIDLVSYTEH